VKKLATVSLLLGLAVLPLKAQEAATIPGDRPFIEVIPHAEYGFAAVLSHEYQSGSSGTLFNMVTQGGEDTLFPYQRYSVDVVLGSRHRVTLLYQPLTLNTRTVADRNGTNGGAAVVIDDAVFPSGTPIDISYGFDFWRVSYLYDFIGDPATILAVGASLQVRNASLVFTSGSGALRSVQQNIGPVPILKLRAAHWFGPLFGMDFEADGFYASSAFFNGSTRAFEGWIWDASLTAKTRFAPRVAAFLTVRSIGGGARGTNAYSYVSSTTSVNPYTYNALATAAVALGVSVE
jgi:hypothetical protein